MRLLETDVAHILRIAGARRSVAAGWAPHMLEAMSKNGINTPFRVAHFVAQVAHESDRFNTMEEYASGAAYEGRKDLGNTTRGDGRRFKGRGGIQLTGRYNYTVFQRWLRENGYSYDVIARPELVAQMPLAMLATTFYWTKAPKSNGMRTDLNLLADRGDSVSNVQHITRLINGGYNGLAHRLEVFRKVMAYFWAKTKDGGEKIEFGPAPIAPRPEPLNIPVLDPLPPHTTSIEVPDLIKARKTDPSLGFRKYRRASIGDLIKKLLPSKTDD